MRDRLENQPRIVRLGPAAVVHAMCDLIVDEYIDIAANIEVDLENLESEVFSGAGPGGTERIYRLNREILEFRRATVPLEIPMREVADGTISLIPDSIRPLFRGVSDHVKLVTAQVETFHDLLSGILSAHLAEVGVRQNEDMRKISAWVAIGAVPTILAGIYGMNFSTCRNSRGGGAIRPLSEL